MAIPDETGAEQELKRQRKLLKRVSEALATLLRYPKAEEGLRLAFESLAEGTGSHAWAWYELKHRDRHAASYRLRASGPAGGATPGGMDLTSDPEHAWHDELLAGRALAGPVKELPVPGSWAGRPTDTKSLVAMPAFVDDRLHGFLALYDLKTSRNWSIGEEQALRTFARGLGADVERRRRETRMWEDASPAKSSPLLDVLESVRSRLSRGRDRVAADPAIGEKAFSEAIAFIEPLLKVAEREDPPPLPVDRVLSELHPALTRIASGRGAVELIGAAPSSLVRIHRDELEEIVGQLVGNAIDAQVRDVVVAVESSAVDLDDSEAKALGVGAGPFVRVTVTDAGEGMEADVEKRAAEPFFTRKSGHHSGLGLTTVTRHVLTRGGALRIETAPGRGTTVRVDLPATAPAVAAAAPEETPARLGRVLHADANGSLREVMEEGLTNRGYDVVGVGDEGALRRALAEGNGATDALILDEGVLGGDSERAVADLRTTHPSLSVVVTTSGPTSRFGSRGLAKPYSLDDLCRALSD